MNRLIVTALFLSSLPVFAQHDDFSKVEIKVHKVAGNVYMLEGAGGNIGVSVGDDGIVIVDDQFAPLAEKIRAALKGIADKPVRFVINTHYHGDHTGGNKPFQEMAPVIAHDNVRKRMAAGGKGGNAASISFDVKSADPGALPILTFGQDMTVHLNGEDIRAHYVPAGHTDGDAVIFFPKSNVVHMGDDFVRYGFPFIDIDAGGSVRGLIKALDELVPKLPADVKIIPGHGQVSTIAEMREFVSMMKDTLAVIEQNMKQGKSLDQMKQAKVLANWEKWKGDFVNTDAWIETIYNDLSGNKGEFKKHN
jgi:cyclase